MIKLALIGAGNMGGAIISGVVNSGFMTPPEIIVCDMSAEKRENCSKKGFHTAESPCEAINAANSVLIAVKPQQIKQLLSEIQPICHDKLIISIAAGVTISTIEESLPGCRVIRVMPNTPLIVGKGVSALCKGKTASDEDFAFADKIFSRAGKTLKTDESALNPMTALTSSSVAYFARFINDMCKWAKKNGFENMDSAELYEIVADTAKGAASLITEAKMTPEDLEKAVTSPNGTTERAMAVFTEDRLSDIIEKAMTACLKRADELSGK